MKSLVAATLFTAALIAGGAAHAQPAGDEPFDITADELEVQNKTCVSTWRGNAEALRGQSRLRASVLRAYFATKPGSGGAAAGTGACGDLLRLEAEGNVYYVTAKDQRVRGDAGTYNAGDDTVTLTGDVVAVQGQNVLRGSRMVFNSQTGEGRMIGSGKTRPRGVFYPSKKTESAAR